MLVRMLLKTKRGESMVWADDRGFAYDKIDWKIEPSAVSLAGNFGTVIGKTTLPDGTFRTFSATYQRTASVGLFKSQQRAKRAVTMALQMAFAQSNYQRGVRPTAKQIAEGT